MKTYFAHSLTDYGTTLEKTAMRRLSARLGDVLNPNGPEHDAGYKVDGMAYFVRLIANLDAVAFMRMPCGSIGAGVAMEVEDFRSRGRPVYEIERDGFTIKQVAADAPLAPVLTVDETRAAIRQRRAAAALHSALGRYSVTSLSQDVFPREDDSWGVVDEKTADPSVNWPGELLSEHRTYDDARLGMMAEVLKDIGALPV